MKSFLFILLFFSSTISHRHHNTKEFTKIIHKIQPNKNICNEAVCPSDRGTCSSDNICYCFDGFMTIYSSSQESFCNYKKKDRIFGFILEFLVSFGVGHLYLERYYFGFVKMAFVAILMGVYFFAFKTKKGIDAARVRVFIMTLFSIWQVIDGICIWEGIYKDGNGKETGFLYF